MVVFDFDGSLDLAREISSLAVLLFGITADHNQPRDTALAVWEGRYGDQFKTLRDAHDRKLDGLTDALFDNANQWVDAWMKAVDDTNKETYEDFRERQRSYNRRKRREAQEDLDEYLTHEIGPRPATVRRWIDEGFSPRPERPEPATRPGRIRGVHWMPFTGASSYEVYDAPFAHYQFEDHVYQLTYRHERAAGFTSSRMR